MGLTAAKYPNSSTAISNGSLSPVNFSCDSSAVAVPLQLKYLQFWSDSCSDPIAFRCYDTSRFQFAASLVFKLSRVEATPEELLFVFCVRFSPSLFQMSQHGLIVPPAFPYQFSSDYHSVLHQYDDCMIIYCASFCYDEYLRQHS